MTEQQTKQAIQAALADFAAKPLADAAHAFFGALGYASDKRIALQPNSAKKFAATFAQDHSFNAKAALVDEWQSVDMLLQLTDDEIRAATSNQQALLFDSKGTFYSSIIESYLFFAIALQPRFYTRTELVGITRAVNRLFPMPVMLLFQHGETITLSVINRRLHKRDSTRDVLEKVTLIKDVQCAAPHRAHIEILHDLSLAALQEDKPCNESISSFVALHRAWQKTLDIQVLNRRFFTEVRNWFYWARLTARFPAGAPKDADGHDSDALIRLLTRLIFCWFVKEKGLIPATLFDQSSLQAILDGYAPDDDHNTNSIFYKAILQNLFFATLNTEMDRRAWVKDDHNFMAHSLYRFRECFKKPGEALALFKNIPFLNGGLFECLDKDNGEGMRPRYIRIDGFSRRPDCQPTVPDFLFFGHERLVPDIAATLGERNAPKARGLFFIFRDYKFTVEENTPLEEDIALDPELAGRIFENLLAAYNPETGVTARKQTGSFYTPREIVNYMVDESLIAYLKTKLESACPSAKDVEARLRHMFVYNDEPHKFSSTEVDALIAAIDNLKALDPAVGSGAFPMGMLHRLVFLLHKLDPENKRWRERQRQRAIRETEETFEIGDRDERARRLEDINNVFEQNASDYGRKLYLIENCIYGVDIQPVAVQIAKMRFFISLVADQKVDDTQPNRGVRPLPNLETKFVAANSLIGIVRPGQQLLRNPDIDEKEHQLRHVRKKHFLARTPAAKAKCREQDSKLRAEIATLLKDDGWDTETAKKLSAWDPYDQNASAPFFDPEWMFGIVDAACRRAAPATMAGKLMLINDTAGQSEFVESEVVNGGFDIVLGNPPYIGVRTGRISTTDAQYYRQNYSLAVGQYDLFVMFIEKGESLLCNSGVLSYIVPKRLLSNESFSPTRRFLLSQLHVLRYLDAKMPFEAAVEANVILCTKIPSQSVAVFTLTSSGEVEHVQAMNVAAFSRFPFLVFPFNVPAIRFPVVEMMTDKAAAVLGDVVDIQRGMECGFNHPAITTSKTQFPVIRGENISRFVVLPPRHFLRIEAVEAKVMKSRSIYSTCPKLLTKFVSTRIEVAWDDVGYYNTNVVYNLLPRNTSSGMNLAALLGLLNSRAVNFWFSNIFSNNDRLFPHIQKNQLEAIPLPAMTSESERYIAETAQRILTVKRKNSAADTSALEREIDEAVYAMYGMTTEEIKIVEEST